MFSRIIQTSNQRSIILIRLMVGAVFLSEGIQKFLFASEFGAGRFAKAGLPNPDFLGPFVGTLEIICGTLILLGLLTRLAAIPLIIIMLMAMATTKTAILANEGIWAMLRASKADWSMFLGSIFLLVKGGGLWSVDYRIQKVTKL